MFRVLGVYNFALDFKLTQLLQFVENISKGVWIIYLERGFFIIYKSTINYIWFLIESKIS